MGRKLTWIAAALITAGLIVAVGVVLLSGSDDEGETAGVDEVSGPVASIPAPSSPAAQAAAIAQVERFWTPQRLREALTNPLPEPTRADPPDDPVTSSPAPSTPASPDAQAEPTESKTSASATVPQGACRQPRLLPAERGFTYKRFCYRGSLTSYPALTTGRLIAETDDGFGFCTASVAVATNKSVLFTAGHCVVDPAKDFSDRKPRWQKKLGFVPAALVKRVHDAIDSPDWEARLARLRSEIWWAQPIPGTDFATAWSHNGWIKNAHWSKDFAAVVIAPRVRNGTRQTIQDALGGQGWDMSGKAAISNLRLLGFPSAKPFAGRILFECRGAGKLLKSEGDSGPEIGVGCDMTPGSSGGPWLVKTNARGLGTIISVNSNTTKNRMWGPRLSMDHYPVMTKAQTTAVG